MSILEKIRNRTGLLVGLVGLALAIFILESLLGSGSSLFGSGSSSVGSIAGDEIDQVSFARKMDDQINMIRQNNPQANVDEMREQVSNQVWAQIINEKIIKPQFNKAGVLVGEDELYDLMLVHPHQIVLQQLTDPKTGQIQEGWARPDGSIDLAKLNQFVNSMNPEYEKQWTGLEKAVSESRLSEKYTNLIKKGLYVTTAEAKEAYNAQNTMANVEFVMKRYSMVSDTAIKVTDEDIQKYYNDHQYEFKSNETVRKIEYVSFDVVPSEKDLADLESDALRVAEEFKTKPAKEDSSYIAEESEGGNVTISDFNKKTMIVRDSAIFTSPAGTVFGPYNEGAYLKIYKLTKIKNVADSARVRHILIGLNNSRLDPKDPAAQRTPQQTKRIADSLTALIKDKKVPFDTLLKIWSDDPGSISKGGDYGWFDENKGFVDPFKNAGLEGKKGDINVVETQFGHHIIEVLDVAKTNHTVYRVAQIFKMIGPSAETTKEYYTKATNFAGQNITGESFDKAVETQKLSKRIADNIKEGDKSLPGLENAKELTKWVYSANKGEVSQVIEFKDRYVVAKLSGIREKGTLPLEEVKEEVSAKARREKKANEFVKEFTAKAGSSKSASDIASKMGLQPEKQEGLNFMAFNVGTLGREDALVGTAFGIKAGNISKPVIGDNGVFVVMVTEVKQGQAPPDYKNQQKQSEMTLGGRVDYDVFNALKEKGDIEDHRSRFE